MAGGADHQGLASPVGHGLGPQGLQWPGLAEVGEFSDVVNLHLTRLSADLANVREESCDDLLVRIVNPDRLAVDDRRRFLPVEWYFTEPCQQRFLPSRSMCASKQVRSPCGVWILVLCLAAIFDIDE